MTNSKVNKYEYLNVIQQSSGQGWEDHSTYEAKSNGNSIDNETKLLLRHDLKEYRASGYPTRLIFRKKLI